MKAAKFLFAFGDGEQKEKGCIIEIQTNLHELVSDFVEFTDFIHPNIGTAGEKSDG